MKISLMSNNEVQQVRLRTLVILGFFLLLFLVLIARLWYLQVMQGEHYEEISTGNRVRVLPLEGLRGTIYDRNGELLAYNRPAFRVEIIPEDTDNLDLTLNNLSRIAKIDIKDLRQKIESNRQRPRFKPVVILENIGRNMADLLDTYSTDLPGVRVVVESRRLYPSADVAAHVTGYVGEISEQELRGMSLDRVYSGRVSGQSGIEKTLNPDLVGVDGGKQVVVDNVGRQLSVTGAPIIPQPGSNIWLTVDLRLQAYIKKIFEDRVGSVLVSNPQTGEILAFASFPDYDPNIFSDGMEEGEWSEFINNNSHVLFNRAIHGLYSPGSTFKPIVALAALEEGLIDEHTELDCPGHFNIGSKTFYCNLRSGHGMVNVKEALAVSCNVFFYKLGYELGADVIADYAARLGFGQVVNSELGAEKPGLVPSTEWKLATLGERWFSGETVNFAIGQGFMAATPMQLLYYINTLANEGSTPRPSVIRQIVNSEQQTVYDIEDNSPNWQNAAINSYYFSVVKQGLRQAVVNGTAKQLNSLPFDVAGKTGTVEVVSRRNNNADSPEFEPHSMFVGFAPAYDPQISVVVVVEHGGSSVRTAVPLADKIFTFYHENIQPLSNPLYNSLAVPSDLINNQQLGFRNNLDRVFP